MYFINDHPNILMKLNFANVICTRDDTYMPMCIFVYIHYTYNNIISQEVYRINKNISTIQNVKSSLQLIRLQKCMQAYETAICKRKTGKIIIIFIPTFSFFFLSLSLFFPFILKFIFIHFFSFIGHMCLLKTCFFFVVVVIIIFFI